MTGSCFIQTNSSVCDAVFAIVLGVFRVYIQKILDRTEMRTRDRMCCQYSRSRTPIGRRHRSLSEDRETSEPEPILPYAGLDEHDLDMDRGSFCCLVPNRERVDRRLRSPSRGRRRCPGARLRSLPRVFGSQGSGSGTRFEPPGASGLRPRRLLMIGAAHVFVIATPCPRGFWTAMMDGGPSSRRGVAGAAGVPLVRHLQSTPWRQCATSCSSRWGLSERTTRLCQSAWERRSSVADPSPLPLAPHPSEDEDYGVGGIVPGGAWGQFLRGRAATRLASTRRRANGYGFA